MTESEKERAGEASAAGGGKTPPPAAKEEKTLPSPQFEASSSPHLHSGDSVSSIMWTVFGALLPAAAVGIFYFGLPGLSVLAFSVLGCMAVEAIYQKATGRDVTVGDGSTVVCRGRST